MDAYTVILDQARASIAAGRTPDWRVLETRVKALADDPAVERRTLQQLQALASVARARRRVTPPAVAAAPPRRQRALRERPTIASDLEVRRIREGSAFVLRWDAVPAVARWEVRLSERQGSRYVVREERELPGEATSLELPLGVAAMRVHLLGRGRGGRLVRRALMSSLTPETWDDRWQRRAAGA